MRVLFLSNNSYGMYSFRKEVVQAAADNAEVYLCTPQSADIAYWEGIGCRFIPCDFDRQGINPFKEIKLFYNYNKILKQIKPDIVFTYTIKPNIYGGFVCARAGIPYVANITGIGKALGNEGFLSRIAILLYRIGLRKAKKVFFQNKYNIDFFVRHHILNSAFDLLPGSGVNLEQYRVSPYPKSSTVDFAFIGRVMREKGIDQYLEAAAIIKANHPGVRFNVYGLCEQNYREKLRTFEERNIVVYHGFVMNLKEVYKTVACTIHPAFYPEGLSNVLLESAASGRPVITTNRPGCCEAVDEGVNGFLIREKDTKDLIDKIEMFLSMSTNERERMGLAGRKIVENRFDRKIVIQKYIDEIDGIIHGKATNG